MRKLRSVTTGLALATVAAVALAVPANAAPISAEPGPDADPPIVDGKCSLREAVIAATTDMATDDCTAGSGADTITLQSGSYSLLGTGDDTNAGGDLDITS